MKSPRLLLSVALAMIMLSVSFFGLAQAQGPGGGQDPEAPTAPQADLTTAITYQGQLKQGSLPVNGLCDFSFILWDDATGGYVVKTPIDRYGVQVTNGLFTVNDLTLESFGGRRRWLQINVRCPTNTGEWTVLSPRQELTSAPSALSLRPGAVIYGDQGGWASAVLQLYNLNTTPNDRGDALHAVTEREHGTGVYGSSPAGYGVFGSSAKGTAGAFESTQGYALSTYGPAVLGGRNPKQIAMLRWYDANKTSRAISVGTYPDQMIFDGEHVWVTIYGDNKVAKIRASDGAVIGTYDSVCGHPNALAFDGTFIWVASEDTACLALLWAKDGSYGGATILDPEHMVGNSHMGMAFDGENIWVTNSSSDSVAKYHAAPDLTSAKYTVGLNPQGIAFDGQFLWTANTGDNSYSRIEQGGAGIATFPLPAGNTGPVGVAFDGANIWITNGGSGTLSKIRAADGAHLYSLNIGSGAFFLAFDGYYMWVTRYTSPGYLVRVPVNGWGETKTFTTGNYPFGVVFDGANIWTADSYSSQVTRH